MSDKPTRHQTEMRLASVCPASWDIKGDRRTLMAERGHAVHEFVEQYNRHRAATGRQTDISFGNELIPELLMEYKHLPPEIQEDIHQLCTNVIETHLLNLETFFGSEETFKADIGPVILSGRLDELHIDGDHAEIVDTKSNHVIPSPSVVAQDFQLKTYGFLVVNRFPQIETVKGTIYTPRYGTFRSAEWEADELHRWGEHLGRLAISLEGSKRKEAVPNSNCQYCAASLPGGNCPAWKKTFGPATVIRSASEAREAGKQILALEQRLKERRGVLQAYTKEYGTVDAGGRRFGYWESESQVIDALTLVNATDLGDVSDPFAYLSVSAADVKKLRRALGKDADLILQDISETKTSTRFSHKAVEVEGE